MKKIVFCGLVIFLTLPLYAENRALEVSGRDAQEIYSELMIDEEKVPESPADPLLAYLKELSGLSCLLEIRGRRSDYRCHLDADLTQQQIGEIYEALHPDLEKVENPGLVGSITYVKKLNVLTFRKSTVVYPGAKPTYTVDVMEAKPQVTAVVVHENAKEIYDALSVRVSHPFGNEELKTVGPLSCNRWHMRSGNIVYRCELTGEELTTNGVRKGAVVWYEDARKIYEVLDVNEEKDGALQLVFFKRVGTLNCTKSHFIQETYSCTLKGSRYF